MNIKALIECKYRILSKTEVYEQQRVQMINDAAKDLKDAEAALKKALAIDDDSPEMDNQVKRLEDECERSRKAYLDALETTLDDLAADYNYDKWKANR